MEEIQTDIPLINEDAKKIEDSESLNTEKTDLQEGAVVDDKMSPENSEYDSADSYSDEEQDVKRRSRASDLEEQSNSGTEGSVILEREEGDGQESVPNKKVDDDEDKKNPQYIPKRGTFYEHDDRTTEDPEVNDKSETEKDKDKKKVWQDKKERWSHDKFNDSEQAPKSRSELIAIYGYDIRNEDGPPRARRRRRYGRGPNKYTRTWEDEAAYAKAPLPSRKKKQTRPTRSDEEFPPLVQNDDEETITQNVTDKKKDPVPLRQSHEKTEPAADIQISQQPLLDNRNVQNTSITYNHEIQNNKNTQPQRPGSGRIVKTKKEIKDSDHRGFTTKTRQMRNFKPDNKNQKILPSRNPVNEEVIVSQNFTNRNIKTDTNIQELEKEVQKLTIDGVYKGGNKFSNNQRQGSVPPRLQGEQKGSKRYSSMRQRSLPEANTPPAVPNYPHPTTFYPNEFNQQPSSTASAQPQIIHQPTPIHTAQVPQIPPQNIPLAQQVPVTAAAVPLQFPVPPGAFPQPPPAAFLQPGVAPPTFIPPQPQQIINYVQSQPTFTPNYQGFQQPFNPVTQPTELYQPQGGITYYSTDQQVVRSAPQKRPKAAIPIVAPPSNERKDLSLSISQIDSFNDDRIIETSNNDMTEVQQ